MSDGVCVIIGCGREQIARGWCRPHYQRWTVHGDPTIGGPIKSRRRRVASCDHCGASFEAQDSKHRFCSRLCANRATADRRTASRQATLQTQPKKPPKLHGPLRCERCGNEFWEARKTRSQVRRYCSLRCRTERSYTEAPSYSCLSCGLSVTPQPKAKARYFCSHACRVAHQKTRRVSKTCPSCGEGFEVLLSRAHRTYCSRTCYLTIAIPARPPTNIERRLYCALDGLGVPYERQKWIGRFVADAWLPEHHMIIEADGEYWHSRPERIERDERLTAFAAERGYPLLRLGETFILGQSIAELGEVIRARCAELTTTSGMRGP